MFQVKMLTMEINNVLSFYLFKAISFIPNDLFRSFMASATLILRYL